MLLFIALSLAARASTCTGNWCSDAVLSNSTSSGVLKVPVGAAVQHYKQANYGVTDYAYFAADVDVFDNTGGGSGDHDLNELWGLRWSCDQAACTSATVVTSGVILAAAVGTGTGVEQADGSTIPTLFVHDDPKAGAQPHIAAQEDETACSHDKTRLHEYVYNATFSSLLNESAIDGDGSVICQEFGHAILLEDLLSSPLTVHAGYTRKVKTTPFPEKAFWADQNLNSSTWNTPVQLPIALTNSDHVAMDFASGGGVRVFYHEHTGSPETVDFADPEATPVAEQDVASTSDVDWTAVVQTSGTWHAVARAQTATATVTMNERSCSTGCTTTGTWSTVSSFTFTRTAGVLHTSILVRDVEFRIGGNGRRHLLWSEQSTAIQTHGPPTTRPGARATPRGCGRSSRFTRCQGTSRPS